MSVVTTNSVLNLLSDLSAAADNIVEEKAPDPRRINEWAALIKNAVDNIVNGGSSSETIPTLVSFLNGRSQRILRVSKVLGPVEIKHLHRKGRVSTNRLSRERKSSHASIRTPLRPSKCNLNKTNIIGSAEATPIASPSKTIDSIQDAHMSRKKSSKRKSSSELSLETVKQAKMVEELSEYKDRDMSMRNGTKIDKLAKGPYPNLKSSGVGMNTSILKENCNLRSKMETKQEKAVENRKNILALRQQKLQQDKRTREEKLEKALQQKIRLEKEKLKLRSVGGQEKILKTSNKVDRPTPKANVENETLERTSNFGKYKEKQTCLKKMQMNLKKAGTSSLKSNEKIQAMKNPKQELNTTYVTQENGPSTSAKKGKTLKDPNIGINSENTKAVSNDNKTQTLKKGVKAVPKTVTSLNEEKKQLASTPKIQQNSSESYAITPARSSFVSYDISEIRSDSEDEEQSSNSKPIPSWATGVHLRNTLLQQHHHPINTEELFGNHFDTIDLGVIMGIKKKAYNKRTSSAVWNSSFL